MGQELKYKKIIGFTQLFGFTKQLRVHPRTLFNKPFILLHLQVIIFVSNVESCKFVSIRQGSVWVVLFFSSLCLKHNEFLSVPCSKYHINQFLRKYRHFFKAPLPKFFLENDNFLIKFSNLCRAEIDPLMIINLGVEERLDTLAKSEVQVLQKAAGSKS